VKVLCLIGDLVRSREVRDRRDLQGRLERALGQLNRRRKGLLSPYTITLGDEFQAVYHRADTCFQDFWAIRYSIYPVRVRFSVGLGNLTTRINPRSAIGMDGPAFHLAREGIEALKRVGGDFRAGEPETAGHGWINPALDLLSHASHNWKRNRLLVLDRLLAGQQAKAIARATGLSQAAVYKNIQAGALSTVARLCEEIASSLNRTLAGK